jgi:hypothetical protein
MDINDAITILANALHDPSEGFSVLGRVGVSLPRFSRWQRFRIWFWLFFKSEIKAQRIILDALIKEANNDYPPTST